MTTTLPFTQTDKNKAKSINGNLVFAGSNFVQQSWFSADAINWTPSAWLNWTDDQGYPFDYGVYFNGEMLYFQTSYSETRFYNFCKTADFLHWEYVGAYSVQFTDPAYDDPVFSFFSEMKIISSGGAIRAFRFIGDPLVRRYSSTNGISWTELETNLPYTPYISKIVSHNGFLYAIPSGGTSYKSVYRSSDDGATWTLLTSNWGIPNATLIDCVATTTGLLAVFIDKETWTSSDGITWTKKNYTLPSGIYVLNNGVILPIGSDLFMVGCGATENNVFKLVDSSGPVGIPL